MEMFDETAVGSLEKSTYEESVGIGRGPPAGIRLFSQARYDAKIKNKNEYKQTVPKLCSANICSKDGIEDTSGCNKLCVDTLTWEYNRSEPNKDQRKNDGENLCRNYLCKGEDSNCEGTCLGVVNHGEMPEMIDHYWSAEVDEEMM